MVPVWGTAELVVHLSMISRPSTHRRTPSSVTVRKVYVSEKRGITLPVQRTEK